MHWVYILKCNNNNLYVGETKTLYKRLNQHVNKKGSKHTCDGTLESLNALYKVQSLYRYLMYCREIENEDPCQEKINEILFTFNEIVWNNKDWAIKVENFITEYLLEENISVNGGKYVNDNKFEIKRLYSLEELKKVPLCKCGLPAEIKCVKNSKYYKLYFTCCIKNVWSKMSSEFKKINIHNPCNYYFECMDGLEFRMIMEQHREHC